MSFSPERGAAAAGAVGLKVRLHYGAKFRVQSMVDEFASSKAAKSAFLLDEQICLLNSALCSIV
jgi:hypothetical protein